jgi:hypothetical protein
MTKAFPFLSTPPTVPPEATEMEVKLTAALETAATAAQEVADECHKAVEEAKPNTPKVEGDELARLRQDVNQSMETTIALIRKINGTVEPPS